LRCSAAGLFFLGYEHIALLYPDTNGNDAVLEFHVVAVHVRGLSRGYLVYEFVVSHLTLFVCIIVTVEQTLVYCALIEYDRVLLVEAVVDHVGDHHLLTVRREVVVHDCAHQRLRAVLLDHETLIHSERPVVHCPAAGLLRLIGEHSYTLGLCVIAEWTQKRDYANQ
jgi:hypothetical protein